MQFSEVLDSIARSHGVWTATVPEDWMQGRSIFGGLQSALALRAMRGLVPAELPLRILQTTFIAPVAGSLTSRRASFGSARGRRTPRRASSRTARRWRSSWACSAAAAPRRRS